MIIDSHVNAWSEPYDPRHHAPSWLSDDLRGTTQDLPFDVADAELAEAGVEKVVLVQVANELGHTDELLAAAAAAPRPTTVVGWLPLADPDATAAALARYAGQDSLVGVRHRVLEHEDPEFLLHADTARSLEQITDAGLALDILPWPPTVLDQVPKIAQQHPNLSVVIDVLGWPDIESREMQPWTDQLAAAADRPNVHIKVAGFYRMTTNHAEPRYWQPYAATAVEVFGTDRIMISSDWPAVAMYGRGYAESIRACLAAFVDLTPSEQEAVCSGTAARIYRLAE